MVLGKWQLVHKIEHKITNTKVPIISMFDEFVTVFVKFVTQETYFIWLDNIWQDELVL